MSETAHQSKLVVGDQTPGKFTCEPEGFIGALPPDLGDFINSTTSLFAQGSIERFDHVEIAVATHPRDMMVGAFGLR